MATTQNYRTFRTQPRQGSKQRGYTEGQAPKRTSRVARNGFLGHAFVPVISQKLACLGTPKQIEREFFNSLFNLGALYGLAIPDMEATDYPQNIMQAFEWTQKHMRKLRPDLALLIVNDEEHISCVATVKVLNTGTCLYYIPVQPLHLLLRAKDTKQQANLLLSVFGYLYQIANMPYFIQSYIGEVYDMIENWLCDDPAAFDTGDYTDAIEELRTIEHFGNRLLKSIRHPYHVQQFANRVRLFRPMTDTDNILLEISNKLLTLYNEYPTRSIFDNCNEGLLYPKDEERIMLHQYVSFFWSDAGVVYEQLVETVNTYFQEMPYMEEPETVQLFDVPQMEELHPLDFEQRLFESICELNEYLNEL